MFHHCKTKEEIKSLYFKLAQYLHPDKGGDSNLFSLLKESYEMAMDLLDLKEAIIKENKKKRRYENTVYDVHMTDKESLGIVD
jgi:DnaJ-class molecular chaperone